MTTSFLQGEVAALSHGRRKASSSWKLSEGGREITIYTQNDPRTGKLSHSYKELKQKTSPKARTKRRRSGKDKPLAILMIQPWERVAKPRITQSFSPETAMSFPPLSEEDGTESPMVVEVEMGGHFVHRVYIDGGASSEVLYEHCFVKLRKEIRDQMVHICLFRQLTLSDSARDHLAAGVEDSLASSKNRWMKYTFHLRLD
ncbi:hypothetical protein Tco_0858214 [Tanacetum coccineum]|uniref:Reverse transcriptase domain-containing protein n=1 Tax=Tanacetum coccineum TaxID=301880 RepID=A0ABQ5BBS9_9ASTR